MIEYTYETEDSRDIYETYEWDNTWLEQANNATADRVLYIGDSISCQIRQFATKASDGKLLFDGYGSSKGIDNPYLKDSIRLFAAQQGTRKVVLFNNGLHGWHLTEDEYKIYYDKIVSFLIDEFKDVPLVLVLTTHIGDEEREKRVVARNDVVLEIANKYNLKVIDLYSESLKLHEHLDEYGVHFDEFGNMTLAKKIVSEIITKE